MASNILLQQIGEDSVNKLKKFITDNYNERATKFEPITEIFLDSESGRYVYISLSGSVASGSGGYAICVLDKENRYPAF